jgi:CHASE3 domain sensor protein
MLSKIWSYFVALVILLLIIGIALQYYISKPIETKELICHKNRLLHKIDDGESVYIRIKGISCEFEKGMIIIEEQS